MANVMRSFALVLEPYGTEQISGAFKKWLQRSAVMPTPSDIRDIIEEDLSSQREMERYRALPQARESIPVTRGSVSWALKKWEELNEQDRVGLANHLKQFMSEDRDKGEGYIKYLNKMCGFPVGFQNRLPGV